MLMAITLGLSIGLAMCDSTVAIGLFTALLFLRPWELIADDDYLREFRDNDISKTLR